MSIENTDYPAVRRVLSEGHWRLDDDAVEELLERTFPDTPFEDVENFMRTVQQFGRSAAPIAQRALPGVAQGAATGAALGPWGALVGGIAGGASAAAGGGARPRAPRRPRPAPGAPGAPAPSTPPPAPTSPPAPTVSGPPLGAAPPGELPAQAAVAQLLTLLSRPETMQALLALLMRAAGRPAVTVGQQQVAPAAFAGAIAEFAAIAAADESLDFAATSESLYDDNGAPRGDIANPAERAALLMADIAAVAMEEAEEEEENEQEEENEEEDIDADWDADESEWDDAIDSYERVVEGDQY